MSILKYLTFKPTKVEERFFNSVLYASQPSSLASPTKIPMNTSYNPRPQEQQHVPSGFAYLDERVRIFKSSTKGKGYGLRAVAKSEGA